MPLAWGPVNAGALRHGPFRPLKDPGVETAQLLAHDERVQGTLSACAVRFQE